MSLPVGVLTTRLSAAMYISYKSSNVESLFILVSLFSTILCLEKIIIESSSVILNFLCHFSNNAHYVASVRVSVWCWTKMLWWTTSMHLVRRLPLHSLTTLDQPWNDVCQTSSPFLHNVGHFDSQTRNVLLTQKTQLTRNLKIM